MSILPPPTPSCSLPCNDLLVGAQCSARAPARITAGLCGARTPHCLELQIDSSPRERRDGNDQCDGRDDTSSRNTYSTCLSSVGPQPPGTAVFVTSSSLRTLEAPARILPPASAVPYGPLNANRTTASHSRYPGGRLSRCMSHRGGARVKPRISAHPHGRALVDVHRTSGEDGAGHKYQHSWELRLPRA